LICEYLYCILTYISLAICPGMVSLDHMIILFLAFWGIPILLPIIALLICITTSRVQRVPVSLHPHQHLFLLWKMAILTGVRWNLSVLLICIYSITKEIEHFFMYLFHLGKNINGNKRLLIAVGRLHFPSWSTLLSQCIYFPAVVGVGC
jgi:hypothetical protein